MSYNQKPPGSSGSGMGGGPPNGPNNMPQVAKTFAGIQQQMQNLVHGQNAIPQSSQADINAFLQQQRIQNMLKQQQQFLQFQHQMQQQQHHQQQHQHHNMAGGGGVGPVPVGGVTGVGAVAAPGSGVSGNSGEPLALTRTAGAADLLNKTYQQQANGNPASNPSFNQLQQTLQALPTNFVQQLQVLQYQMQAKQMQQQQHAGGQVQHVHGQQQPVQGVPPPSAVTTALPHQQQQQQQQKHQNQQQQQQNVLSRYLTAAAAQAAAVSGNKMSSATTPPPPPLTNQMKPPNLPPNTQITPVTAASISAGPHPKMSTGNANTGTAKHPAPPPSISLTPSKSSTSGPSVAHQQNKFTPPANSGVKGHVGHSQTLPKSTHGATHTATSNTTSSSKTGASADATVAPSKSSQSTPVQLTKQMPPMANTAATSNKTVSNATTTAITTESTSTTASPLKSATTTPTAATTQAPIPTKTSTISAAVGPTSNITTTPSTAATNDTSIKGPIGDAAKSAVDDSSTAKPPKLANIEKDVGKANLKNEIKNPPTDSNIVSDKKQTEKPKEKKQEGEVVANKSNNEVKSNSPTITSSSKVPPPTALTTSESKPFEEKQEKTTGKANKMNNHEDVKEIVKKLPDEKTADEKNKPATNTDVKSSTPDKTPSQNAAKEQDPVSNDVKKAPSMLNQVKNTNEDKKIECKEKIPEKEKEKPIKANKVSGKVENSESIASKDVQKITQLVEKSNSSVETAPVTTAQSIPVKILKKDEANSKISSEVKNKNNTSESEQIKNEGKPTTAPVNDNAESTKSPPISGTLPENLTETAPTEDEVSLKPLKLAENLVTATSAKTTLPQAPAKKSNTDDIAKESTATPQKETLTVVSTPAKKVGRLSKATKLKSVAAPPLSETKTTTDSQEDKPTTPSTRVKRKPKPENSHVSDSASSTPKDDDSDRKSKRHRLKTILYQSPLPELAYITKLSASEASNSPKPMSNEDRLIVFYKNEYMAVRNAEGTFYLCQTMQNVYRTSPRISIRWLSEDAKDNNVFIPDFYDHTDIECVLTTVELKRIDKGHLRLPKGERNRIESILKKAIDVEQGLVPRPELTEENPDGLDISLFKDESQIEKKSALTDGSESLIPSISTGRKSRRGAAATSSVRKSITAAVTPSMSSGNKRNKRNVASAGKTLTSNSRKSTKKRKTLVKRKKKIDNSDDEDDDETSDDCESDAEYKPTQKRSSLNASNASKSAPRAQRSPLAKARAASPITPTTSRSKNVPQKIIPTPSTSKASRGERAAKRKAVLDTGSSEEAPTPVKKPTTTSNNKSKASVKHANEATSVKKSSPIDNSSGSSS